MTKFSLPLITLIYENISIVMTFAFSRVQLETLRRTKFVGEWKYLDHALFDISEKRAARACIELATFIRLLDDQECLADYLSLTSSNPFGRVIKFRRQKLTTPVHPPPVPENHA